MVEHFQTEVECKNVHKLVANLGQSERESYNCQQLKIKFENHYVNAEGPSKLCRNCHKVGFSCFAHDSQSQASDVGHLDVLLEDINVAKAVFDKLWADELS